MFQWLTTSQAGHLLLTLLISAVPVIELRGGIPYGIAQGANPGHPDHLRRCPDCGNPGNAGVHRCESAAFSGINETEEAQNEKARLYLLG